MTKIIKIFLVVLGIAWGVFCFSGILNNYESYSVIAWMIILCVSVLPYIAGFFIIKSLKKHPKVYHEQRDTEFSDASDTPATRQPVVSISTSSAPENVLRSMRNSYTAIQFEGDLRIFQDCVDLIQKTTNLDTFFSRYELGMQKALTMRQAEQAKFPGAENGQLLVDSFIQIAGIQRERVLTDSFEQEKIKIEALSTPRGRRNRWEKYLALLQEHETDFDVDCPHVYSAVAQYVEGQITALASEK